MIKKIIISMVLMNFFSVAAKETIKFKRYDGAWFNVQYPENFKPKPSIKSQSGEGYDSCYFISPDKKVKFYVYSPQWSGEATDIVLKDSTEKASDEKTTSNKNTTVKFFTFEAKDKSYSRSYVETSNEENNTKNVLGIEYSDKKSYEKYKKQYLQFKKSLTQFAD